MTARKPVVRQYSTGDWPEIMDIEDNSHQYPWLEFKFRRTAMRRGVSMLVAELECEVVGFIVFERLNDRIVLLNMAVHGKYRRNGIGRDLMERCKKRTDMKVNRVVAEVWERSVAAQLFLKNEGFVRIDTLKNVYEDAPDDDCYLFQWKRGGLDAN